MKGDERERFCSKCGRTIVNLSALNDEQRRETIASAPPGGLCVAYEAYLNGEPAPALSSSAVRVGAQFGATVAAAAAMAALGSDPDTAARTFIAALDATERAYSVTRDRFEEAVYDVRTYFGAKPPPPRPVMIMGIAICPPSPAPAGPTHP